MDSLHQDLGVQMTDGSSFRESGPFSELDSLKEEIKQLKMHFLFKTKQVVDTLDKLQSMCNTVTEERNRVSAKKEKGLMPKQQKRAEGSCHKVFSVVTWGHAWNDGIEIVYSIRINRDWHFEKKIFTHIRRKTHRKSPRFRLKYNSHMRKSPNTPNPRPTTTRKPKTTIS